MNLVYVLFRDVYGKPLEYRGVFSSHESANEHRAKLENEEENLYGYSSDYVVRPVKLDAE